LRLGVVLAVLALHAAAVPPDAQKLVIARDGFRPDTLKVRRGETLRLQVETADDEHCFAVDELRVEKRVLPGKSVLVELTPERAGTLRLYCCLEGPDNGPRGKLVVTD
jgi:heme/copper-type cytochrome/quinol oxidase subunit 2